MVISFIPYISNIHPSKPSLLFSSKNCQPRTEVKAEHPFYLLTTSDFYASYLISGWLKRFANDPNSKGVWIREEAPQKDIERKIEFHNAHAGEGKTPTTENNRLSIVAKKELSDLYGNISASENAMISMFGIPDFPQGAASKIHYIGKNVNGPYLKMLVGKETPKEGKLAVFTCLDRILKDWWFQLGNLVLVNGHPAVLPQARGSHAIQHIAIDSFFANSPKQFEKAAGGSIHHIDERVDGGAIIQTETLKNPFQYKTMAHVKAASWEITYRLLLETAAKYSRAGEKAIPKQETLSDNELGKEYKSRYYFPWFGRFAFIRMRKERLDSLSPAA